MKKENPATHFAQQLYVKMLDLLLSSTIKNLRLTAVYMRHIYKTINSSQLNLLQLMTNLLWGIQGKLLRWMLIKQC